ncbi:hypothetical protein SUDANB96_02360 [Streptomyces sp. enrichment culture]
MTRGAGRCGPGAGGPRAPIRTPGRAAPTGVRYFCTVDKKNALRAGALAAGTTLMMLLMSSPALALTRDDGDDPGTGLSVIETLGLFVIAPLALFAVITGLVMVLDRSAYKVEKPKLKAKAKARA